MQGDKPTNTLPIKSGLIIQSKLKTTLKVTKRILEDSNENEIFNWWHNLNSEWKLIFLNQNSSISSTNINIEFLKEILRIEYLNCNSLEKIGKVFYSHMPPIKDIQPIEKLKYLTSFSCCSKNIYDLSPISACTHLSELWLSFSSIEDISALVNLTNLEYLYLSHTKIKSLEPILGLKKLKFVSLINTNINLIELKNLQANNPNCIIVF